MADETNIPFPVRFNPIKHHRNYILGILESISPEVIISLLDPICNNYVDIYTGAMTPEAIGDEVVSILKSNKAFQEVDFNRWVATKNGYRQIKLADQSEWIVRKGNETARYVHIHPARNCPFTIRFKGSTLKTAYLLKTSFTDSREIISLEKVNRIRIKIGLSPVKKLGSNSSSSRKQRAPGRSSRRPGRRTWR
jgi:hypothetical protein